MASSNFIDYVKINVRSGSGGAGSLHFRREKHVEKGGPDGGDGGRGGHVILKGNSQLWTLLHLKYTKHLKAFDGKGGEGGRRSGSIGKDIIVEVPLGTIAKNAETGEQLFEITEDGQEVILLQGGRGGMGNDHFKSATNQTPQHAQTGEAGLEAWVILELKVLADVGLVGFPNAGKSTLLSVVSAARPEIADYPFTTLVPNLGVVSYRDYKSFVMADIPGIIEGASQGKGLGLRFLRHIERNSILLFMVPADSEDINAEYETLLQELRIYNPSLLDKNRILAISKIDVLSEEERDDLKKQIPASIPNILISAITQEGIEQLKDQVWNLINSPLSVK
ncbi:GTPase ObgE [Dyadobacter fanqingshengii]|uniref:GTPase Obg n=1 Tax=Dyadobacter fanqingshengii TaxID=2906443 RepID=A0A9X1T7R1_9BACT|nr:GTPase ObgE [Dyadobacter fanqingshengii]MCF0038568.1 GTPase ObgE [Dyadobacter fanqingshengii]MCF2503903.1 GTPase ObgE [Dyadobacter fanqingshengii]USJ34599.1 GTPase ObgE [Dyadobacter fanqingshengii]